MLKVTIRYILAALIVAILVFLVLTLASVERAENSKFAACQNEISSECLTELGVELATDDQSLPRYMREVGMLAQMGRLEDAFTLELRIEGEKDRPQKNVEGTVNRRLASHRITAAIRSGENLQRTVEKTPSVAPGVLWISALGLLGRSPYGVSTGLRRTPNDQTIITVSDMAAMIVTMAQDEAVRSRIREVQLSLFAKSPLRSHAHNISDQQHAPLSGHCCAIPCRAVIIGSGSTPSHAFPMHCRAMEGRTVWL